MTLRDTPIRQKLMTILLMTSGAVVVLTCAAFFAYEFLTFRQTAVRELSTLGEVIASNSTAALAFDNQNDATEILGALRAERHIVAAALYDKDGKFFARYPATLAATDLPVTLGADGHRFTTTALAVFQPVMLGGKRLGTLYLRSDLAAMYERFRLYGGIVVLVIAVSFLVAYLLARVLQRQISVPIVALAETAQAISVRQDYSVRARKLGRDELGLLTDAFNQMLAQIQKLNLELEQRVLDRTAQLEAANRELEAYSYSVSHDLRAPLRHVDGFASMLSVHAASMLDDKGRHYLATISDAAQRMGRLIDDLLVFSRYGRAELQRATVNLAELVREVRERLQAEAVGRTIVWTVAELPVVSGDVAMLRQVFENLLGNAVKYSRLRAEARIAVGTLPADAGFLTVFVRDNGAGFDMKYADKLFGVFQRLHSAHEFEGTGVGLANVQRIVQRHGGRTWAEGRVDGGATFYFTLPVTAAVNGQARSLPSAATISS